MSFASVVGVDPGGQSTCIVELRRNGELVNWLVERGQRDMQEYVVAVNNALFVAVGDRSLLAVEDLNPPSPHMGMTSVGGLLDTAQVIGGIRQIAAQLHRMTTLVMVPPGGHGSSPLEFYPSTLVGPRETKGTGALRHCRSAYDVALAGKTLHAYQKGSAA